MIVWILERGCYSDRYVYAIYSTAEAAMADWNKEHPQAAEWEKDEDGCWSNNGHWDMAADVIRYEVRS